MKLAVVVLPTYNEKGNIEGLIESVFKETEKLANWQIKILVVDSKSADGTGELVRKLVKKFPGRLGLLETEKEGLGKAYLKGFSYALETMKPYVVFEMDADWSHNPKDIPEFLNRIEKGADFVIGSRYMKGGSIPANWGIHRKIFSVIGNLIVRFGLMRPAITEWTNGFRAIKSWLIKDLIGDLSDYSGYVFQVAFLDKTINKGAVVDQVPVKFIDRKAGKSKINPFQYISQICLYVLMNSSFIKFVIVGLIGFVIDFGISYLLISKLGVPKSRFWLATVFSSEVAIIANFILNNYWSFAHKKLEQNLTKIVPSFLKFNLVSLGSIVIQSGGIQIFTNIYGPSLWYVYKVGIIAFVIIPYSYILYNKFIWKNK